MKKSLLASTLLAASVLVVPAFAGGDGTSSDPYTGTVSDLDLSGTYTDNTAYINGVTSGNFISGEYTFSTGINIGSDGLTLNSGTSGDKYTFSGTITGSGDWTYTTDGDDTEYVFTGNVSGYTGTLRSGGTITFDETGTGDSATVINATLNARHLVIGGTGDYVINGNINAYYTSTVSRNSITITTSGTVTFNCSSFTDIGMFTASDANTTLVFASDCTLGITFGDTSYGIDVAGTIQVAAGKTLTLNKAATAHANVGTLELGQGSTLTLTRANTTATSSESDGLYIGTLKLTGTSATVGTTYDSNYISIGALVGTNATLNLTSDSGTTHANVFELGSSTTETTSQFTGTITVSDTNTSGGRGVSLAISDEKIAAGAVIVLGEEDNSNTSLSLGVNASRVEIAGLSTTSAQGGDIIYAGKFAVDTEAGNAGANITSNSETRNTLAINTTADASYTFSGKVLNMLNLEKSGTGTQAFVFASDSTFDGSIAVKDGTLALSGEAISSTGITVDSGATLTIGNTVTLATTSDVSEVSSKISGAVTITGTLNVGGTTMTLDTTLGTTQAGTVAFSDGAKLILSNEFLASAVDDTITIIMASSITYNGSALDSDASSFASAVISYDTDSYLLSGWSYSEGVLSASVTYLPEPSMFGLMFGLGAIGLVATRRRRRA